MNYIHLHLLLNHFPTVGFGLGLALFVAGLSQRSADLKRASLVIFVLLAALTILTFVTGNDAQAALRETPGVPAPAVDAHETAALLAFVVMQVTGVFSWLGLWTWRRAGGLVRWNAAAILIGAVATTGLMAGAANLGGQIRHPEIQGAGVHDAAAIDPAQVAGATPQRSRGRYVEEHSWVWPTCEVLHYVGLCLLCAAVIIIDLRILGVGKQVLSFGAVYQLLPLGEIGFVLNLATGLVFFTATPQQYTGVLFVLKMLLVVLGAANLLYFVLADELWTIDEGHDAPIRAKMVAGTGLAIWVAVVFCGRMLPALGNAF